MNRSALRLLERHFDTAFDAPDGIKKLRELILTLAMRGELVPQDPEDQPASELLVEIEAEKADNTRHVAHSVHSKAPSISHVTRKGAGHPFDDLRK